MKHHGERETVYSTLISIDAQSPQAQDRRIGW